MTTVDDMVSLPDLSQDAILANLRGRFFEGKIYTRTGSVLIAVNPFKRVNLYTPQHVAAYAQRRATAAALAPHVYQVAEAAYRGMLEAARGERGADARACQSVLISGESGAGKTETSKILLQYFAAMGERQQPQHVDEEEEEAHDVQTQVLASTPILESFGNARTVRNGNSSRFGKFIEIYFDREHGRIHSARLRTYLLEKSRVVAHASGERTFHIFYEVLAGANDKLRAALLLESDAKAADFRYLRVDGDSAERTAADLANDARQFTTCMRALEAIGVESELAMGVLRTVAAILHLGNCEFGSPPPLGERGASAANRAAAAGDKGDGDADDADRQAALTDASRPALDAACQLLGVEPERMERCLLFTKLRAGGEVLHKANSVAAAGTARDSMAMLLYSRLFDWLVAQVNSSMRRDGTPADGERARAELPFIGLLDIFGFEVFEHNHLEQLLINTTNERLQRTFNEHVFKLEQSLYMAEGIEWSYIDFPDNSDILELIERGGGLFALLDEECRFPRADATTLTSKFAKQHGKHERFSVPRFSKTHFSLRHYAGEVTYGTETFLEHNRDAIAGEHVDLLRCGAFVGRELIGAAAAARLNAQKRASICAQFKSSLQALMETINETDVHFIRCVKPSNQQPDVFHDDDVMRQLQCAGVLETIRVMCAGFPSRRAHEHFVQRYAPLFGALARDESRSAAERARAMLERLGAGERAQIGHTMVFLKAGLLAQYEELRVERLAACATLIQARFRGHVARARFVRLRAATVTLQCAVRARQARARVAAMRRERAAVRLQAVWRAHSARQQYVQLRAAALAVQAAWRVRAARRQLLALRRTAAATAIQRLVRARQQRARFLLARRRVVRLQALWRGKQARRVYRKLRIEANSVATIKSERDRLLAQLNDTREIARAEALMRARVQRELDELRADYRALQARTRDRVSGAMRKHAQQLHEVTAAAEQTSEQLTRERKLHAATERTLAAATKRSQAAERKARELAQALKASGEEIERLRSRELQPLKMQIGALLKENARLHDAAAVAEERAERLEAGDAADSAGGSAGSRWSWSALGAFMSSKVKTPDVARGRARATSSLRSGAVASSMQRRVVGSGHSGGTYTPVVSPPAAFGSQVGGFTVATTLLHDLDNVHRSADQFVGALLAVGSYYGHVESIPVPAFVLYSCLAHWPAERAGNLRGAVVRQLKRCAADRSVTNARLMYWMATAHAICSLINESKQFCCATPLAKRHIKQQVTTRLVCPTPAKAAKAGGAASPQRSSRATPPTSPLVATISPSKHGRMVIELEQQDAEHDDDGSDDDNEDDVDAQQHKKQQHSIGAIGSNEVLLKKLSNWLMDSFNTLLSRLYADVQESARQLLEPELSEFHSPEVIATLERTMNELRRAQMPRDMIVALMESLFASIDAVLFNEICLRSDLCSMASGVAIKMNLTRLLEWCRPYGEACLGTANVNHVLNLVNLLMLPKGVLNDADVRAQALPLLSRSQIRQVLSMYTYGEFEERVSPDIVQEVGDGVGNVDDDCDDGGDGTFLLRTLHTKNELVVQYDRVTAKSLSVHSDVFKQLVDETVSDDNLRTRLVTQATASPLSMNRSGNKLQRAMHKRRRGKQQRQALAAAAAANDDKENDNFVSANDVAGPAAIYTYLFGV